MRSRTNLRTFQTFIFHSETSANFYEILLHGIAEGRHHHTSRRQDLFKQPCFYEHSAARGWFTKWYISWSRRVDVKSLEWRAVCAGRDSSGVILPSESYPGNTVATIVWPTYDLHMSVYCSIILTAEISLRAQLRWWIYRLKVNSAVGTLNNKSDVNLQCKLWNNMTLIFVMNFLPTRFLSYFIWYLSDSVTNDSFCESEMYINHLRHWQTVAVHFCRCDGVTICLMRKSIHCTE